MRHAMGVVLFAAVTAADPAVPQGGVPITVADAPAGRIVAPVIEAGIRFQGTVASHLDVIRLVRVTGESVWRLAELGRIEVSDHRAILSGAAGMDTLLLLRAAGQTGYLIAGPLRWPAASTSIDVPVRWRRTVRGQSASMGTGPITWLARPEDGPPASAPMCAWLRGGEWECIGVPLDAAGVVLSAEPGQVLFAIASGPPSSFGTEVAVSSSARWGRLMVIGRSDRVPVVAADAIKIAVRKLQVPRMRQPPSRVHTEPDARVKVQKVTEGVFWVSGTDAPDETWVEVAAVGRAPARVAIPDLVSASGDIPLHVDLDDAGMVSGRVRGAAGAAAPGAIVTLYRLIADARIDRKRPPRRVTVAEVTSDAEGGFQFREVAREPHQLLAMHREWGRAERSIDPDAHDVDLVLRPPSRASGRVLRDGVPAAGVRVTTVPDLGEFAAAEDVTELAGGETETDRDGRFTVSMAPRGTVELRIGGESTGVRRVSLGAVESLPLVVDVGTIDLVPLPPLTLVLEESIGCELALTGPIGRAGVTIHRATRLGPSMYRARLPESGSWLVSATCRGERERDVSPGTIELAEGAVERTVQLVWR